MARNPKKFGLKQIVPVLAVGVVTALLFVHKPTRDFFGSISATIASSFNKDNLYDPNGQKFMIGKLDNTICLFFDFDLADFTLEKNKIILAANWQEFVKQNTSFKVNIIITPINVTDAGLNDLNNLLNGWNNMLVMSKRYPLDVCVAKDDTFRRKHNVPEKSSIVVFADKKKEIWSLGSFYIHLYSANTMLFLNQFDPIFGRFLREISQEPVPEYDGSQFENKKQ